MTISINSSGFSVKNAQGQVKFTSNEKLVYLKYRQINTIDFYGYYKQSYPFYPLGEKDFFMLFIKFNSCSGNAIDTSLIGRWIPANGSIITNFRGYGGGPNGEAVAETKILAAAPNSGSGAIAFSQYRSDYRGLLYSIDRIAPSGVSGNLTYDARIYSYL